ncbi:MAG: 3-isopropylmalate dehydratase [Gemmatimonadales bacterium]|nr:MAG: 3-isopropylmalate dehydratase [Gemmatimonadales bacterium]
MLDKLLNRTVAKRPDTVKLQGRVLFLTEDPELIRRQLAGEDLDWDPSIPLRDDISTDEITPAWVCYYYDEKLGQYPYVGLRCNGEFPIGKNDILNGGFVAAVSGKRRGKGSSREASPYAERAAGIRIVIAENIERIYRENCENLGVLTTTDFSVIDRIRRGEEMPLSMFTEGAGHIQRDIIEYGGLLDYAVARLKGLVTVPQPVTQDDRPMTIAEKILAKHWVEDLSQEKLGVPAVKPGDAGFVRTDIRFSHEYVTPMASAFWDEFAGVDAGLNDPDSIYFFRDHLAFLDQVITEERKAQGLLDAAHALHDRQKEFAARKGIRLHGELAGRVGSEAICHVKVLSSYAEPGHVVVGSDSHTPHSGAIGCVAFGVGTTAVVNSWATRDVRLQVPRSVKIEITGRIPGNVAAKDMMLEILAHPYVRGGDAIGKIIEYCGEAVEALSIDERATLTNMAAEVGAFTGIVAPDATTVAWLVAERGMSRARAEALIEGLESDEAAEYEWTMTIDGSALRPMVATPGDPGNGIPIDELPDPVPIDIVYAGSCTGAKPDDIRMAAEVVRAALDRGERVSDSLIAYLQYGSVEVERFAHEEGFHDMFLEAGLQVLAPGCGACINAGPGVSTTPDQVTVSSINRNFPGRSGPGMVYLASPYTVIASAFAGRIVEFKQTEKVAAGV